MAETHGTQETKEALVALLAVSKLLATRLKDGLQLEDGVALAEKLVLDEEFKSLITKAVENHAAIPEELKDLSTVEALDLLLTGAAGVRDIVAELRAA